MTDIPKDSRGPLFLKWAAQSVRINTIERESLTDYYKDMPPSRLKNIDMNLCNHLLLATNDEKALGLWRRDMVDTYLIKKQYLGYDNWIKARTLTDAEFIEDHSKWLLSTHNNRQEERERIRENFSMSQIDEAGKRVSLAMAEYEYLKLAEKKTAKGVHNQEKYWVATPTLIDVYNHMFQVTVQGESQ